MKPLDLALGAAAAALLSGGGSPPAPPVWPAGLVSGVKFLAGVHPQLVAFFEWWNRAGPFPIRVTSGVRTDAQQRELYAQGRTKPGLIVTNAQTSADSPHGHAAACDAYPLEAGKLVLDGADPRWAQYGQEAERFGLVWGGRWTALKDSPHVEVMGWRLLPVVS